MSVKHYNQQQFNDFRIYGSQRQVGCESVVYPIFRFYFLLLIFSIIDVSDGTYPSIYQCLVDVTSAYPQKTLGTLATLGIQLPSWAQKCNIPKR